MIPMPLPTEIGRGEPVMGSRAIAERFFFIVGAPKAGTTWLATSLAEHRDVHLSLVKEPHFFAPPVPGELPATAVTDTNVWPQLAQHKWIHSGWIRDPGNYVRLLRAPQGKPVSGEATVAYLHAPEAARNIATRFPDARIIIMIREPIARALSHFQMDLVAGRTAKRAESVLLSELECRRQGRTATSSYLGRSLYAESLRRYLDVFDREQVLVLRFDDVASAPESVLAQVQQHLGISSAWATAVGSDRKNVTRYTRWKRLNFLLVQTGAKNVARRVLPSALIDSGRRFLYTHQGGGVLSEQCRAELRGFFKRDIEDTAALSGLDLASWLR